MGAGWERLCDGAAYECGYIKAAFINAGIILNGEPRDDALVGRWKSEFDLNACARMFSNCS